MLTENKVLLNFRMAYLRIRGLRDTDGSYKIVICIPTKNCRLRLMVIRSIVHWHQFSGNEFNEVKFMPVPSMLSFY